MDETHAYAAGAAVLVTALGKAGVKWLKARAEAQRAQSEAHRALRAQIAAENASVREDTGQHFTLALNASEDVRKQVQVWLSEERQRYEECRQETRQLRADLIQLQSDMRALKRENRDLRMDAERAEREIAWLKKTLVEDYARKPSSIVPAGDAETPIIRALKSGGDKRD